MASPNASDLYYGHPGIMAAALSTNGMCPHPEAGKREAAQCAGTMGAVSVDQMHFCDLWLPNPQVYSGARPVALYIHGRDSDKRAGLQTQYFFPSLQSRGIIVLSFNYLQCNLLTEQTQLQEPYADALWIELFRNRAVQARRMFDWFLGEFDISEHTDDFTIDPDLVFCAGSSFGGTLICYGLYCDTLDGYTLPAYDKRSQIRGAFPMWTALSNFSDYGPLWEYDPSSQYFHPDEPPVNVIHGTDDPHQWAKPEAGQAIYDSAIAAGLSESRLTWLQGAVHSPWASHWEEIRDAIDDFINSFRESTQVSDYSPFSIADAMIWAALTDTTNPASQTLLSWRRQQRQDGHSGKNFDAGEIPLRPAGEDCPALSLLTTAPADTPVEYQGKSATTRIYEITIRGHLDVPEHREADGDKLVKRFQHLAELAIGRALRDLRSGSSKYVPAGESNPITDIWPGDPVFPDWRDTLADHCFEWPITLTLDFGPVWIS